MGHDSFISFERSKLTTILRDIPSHLRSAGSWKRLFQEPAKCFLYVAAPAIFVVANFRRRSTKNEIFHTALNRLVDVIDTTQEEIPVEDWPMESDLASLKNLKSIETLTHQFAANKSDKHLHGYANIYQVILTEILSRTHAENTKVVEIGIGSTNPKIPSNMGIFGTPGASLRTFRDYSPNTQVVGGDIDRTALFAEPGITTFFVDQLDTVSLRQFFGQAGSFDLFVEDGLHRLDANLNSLCVALEFAKTGAWVVIEDIDPENKSVWLAVAKCLKSDYRSWVIRAKNSVMFVAQHK